MKKMLYLAALCMMVMLTATSCTTEDEVSNPEEQLIGTWQKTGTQEFVRFLGANEETMEDDYYFGYEWDEGDDVHPEDLKYHGEGWFKWKVETDTMTYKPVIRLMEIHLMDNGSADIPKIYTIQTLTETTLIYTDGLNTPTFMKVK